MSTDVTMQELESETAELLPSRETLCTPRPHPCCGSGVTQVGLININDSFNNYGILGL
jgi:hypothetical protein